MKEKHSFADVLAEAIRVGLKKPNRTSTDEYFKPNGKPCCIFGHAFAALGLTAQDIDNAMSLNRGYAIRHTDFEALGISDPKRRQMEWATRVQDAQDSGSTWGEALKLAGPVPA